ncbi:hypothetical protein EDC01DRAFT_626513 [Geopyxis carbonaria]|nr:hypothetical protein EDC01DRAFT_626513 [Geopyxis carbonaria]
MQQSTLTILPAAATSFVPPCCRLHQPADRRRIATVPVLSLGEAGSRFGMTGYQPSAGPRQTLTRGVLYSAHGTTRGRCTKPASMARRSGILDAHKSLCTTPYGTMFPRIPMDVEVQWLDEPHLSCWHWSLTRQPAGGMEFNTRQFPDGPGDSPPAARGLAASAWERNGADLRPVGTGTDPAS